jgi:dihydrolipoamide dehydrogenase
LPSRFDIAVLGGGPGGYVAALRAAQLGARVAVVERDRLGGTCLVRGCIPTKAMLQSSELYSLVRRGGELGVVARDLKFDFPAATERRDKVVDQLVNGVGSLLKAAKIEVLNGHGTLRGRNRISVDGNEIEAGDVIIATGSVASRPPIKGVEHTINSDQILDLKQVPQRMAVIGGGVVGMEWGALFAALGTKVTVIEMLPQILPMVEADLVQVYVRHFQGLGGAIHTQAKVEQVGKGRRGLQVRFSSEGETQQVDADVVLLATGRVPYTDNLGAEEAGVELEKGRIVVDQHLRTAADRTWAIGDVIGGIMLAHVASYEGVCAVENICEGKDRVPDYHAAPNCIYTDPEIAHVGLSERDARRDGVEVRVGKFPFQASGRALTLGQAEGFVKVVADAAEGRILGVHMVGPRVTDLIAEATLAVQQRLPLSELELTMHAHPTLAESLLEAALATESRAVHIPNRARPQQPAGARPAAARSAPAQDAESVAKTDNHQEENEVARAEVRTKLPPPEPPAAAIDLDKLKLNRDNKNELLKLYRLMLLIRRFEEQTGEEYKKAKIGGYLHVNLGEEATVVGGITPLKPGDYIYTAYREHGHAIARGTDPKAVMAELFGKETGTSHGRGGSMHIFDYKHRFMGGYGIVGGHLPLAVGAGFAIRYQQAKDIVFCMFGDGATNIGAFHEALNFSKVFKLPIVWFCINNQYGMGTAVERASAVKEIYRRACAYDMESIRIDGNNLLEVLERTGEFVEKTRQDSQPRFIESVCYRFKGHSVVDPDKYRDNEEKERWIKSDPIRAFEQQLKEGKVAREEDFKKIRGDVEGEVEQILRFADESPDPSRDELYRYLYAGEWETVKSG